MLFSHKRKSEQGRFGVPFAEWGLSGEGAVGVLWIEVLELGDFWKFEFGCDWELRPSTWLVAGLGGCCA